MLNRETIYGAVYARLSGIAGIVTLSRRLRAVTDVPSAEQPALFMAQTYQRPEYETGRTTFWNLGANLYLYVRDPKDKTPGVLLNPLMDAICAKFQPDNQQRNACTLGGLAHYCRIGPIETDEGTLGEQAVAIIPLDIRVPGNPL